MFIHMFYMSAEADKMEKILSLIERILSVAIEKTAQADDVYTL